jgi:L-fuconolactonase
LTELALSPNVACKLSGLATEADRSAWTTDDLAPYVEHALDCFGPERLLYGSDWPVVNLAGGLGPWLDAARTLLGGLPPRQRAGIFGSNAARIYGL